MRARVRGHTSRSVGPEPNRAVQPYRSSTISASTAICGLTFSSRASRQARMASSRRRAPSGPIRLAAVSMSAARSGLVSGVSAPQRPHQHVAVEAGEVDQGPVEHVALRAGRPRLLPTLQLAHHSGGSAHGGGGPLAGTARAERGLELLHLGLVAAGGLVGRLLLGHPRAVPRPRRTRRTSTARSPGMPRMRIRWSRLSGLRASARARPT